MSEIERKEEETIEAKTFSGLILHTKVKVIFNTLLYVVLGPVLLYGILHAILHWQSHCISSETKTVTIEKEAPIFWIYANNTETGYLRHVLLVLERLGFQRGSRESSWDLLWAHDYPFTTISNDLTNLKRHQKVNHFPGCGYITNKVLLSTTEGKHLPAAFKIPDDADTFLKYVAHNPNKSFVQKSNSHRGIKIYETSELNLAAKDTFIQEFIERPYLVDGYKFDIGVYTVITSVDPLRVYTYKGDVLFRFCPVKYYPFDPENVDKYVVGDDYLPIWKVPSLQNYYSKLGFSMKDSFDAYVKSRGEDPWKVWHNIHEAIRDITLKKEAQIKQVVNRYGNGRNFFELVRFDFSLDENLNVFTMEANMSPNLSSAHFPPNQLLYEQVLFNLFALVGIGQRVKKNSLSIRTVKEQEMEVADKNIVIAPELCALCEDCFRLECQLCKPCFTDEMKLILTQSYLENQNKMDYYRIFPPSVTEINNMSLTNYTLKNQLLMRWYQRKCESDFTWCT
ncbi:tubulin polyglutamylase TTLL6 [Orussus abietinus]|uniref:tubulin polyglutamylase TTLL6 n=1 Tax=Orussus abietinus TaxID=222816 RepID=UPI000626215C|nr:tubulin polyglutamylase TTLL6 [Orussus abietinus]